VSLVALCIYIWRILNQYLTVLGKICVTFLYRTLLLCLPTQILHRFMALCVVTGQGRVFYREHFALQIRWNGVVLLPRPPAVFPTTPSENPPSHYNKTYEHVPNRVDKASASFASFGGTKKYGSLIRSLGKHDTRWPAIRSDCATESVSSKRRASVSIRNPISSNAKNTLKMAHSLGIST